MNFKAQLEHDIKAVFLNPEEFAEVMHVVYDDDFEGDIPVVLDEMIQEDRPEADQVSDRIQGVFRVTTMFYAAESDMGVVPKKERNIWVGSVEYKVITSACDMGQIMLGLQRFDE